jgi:hypothetical protein
LIGCGKFLAAHLQETLGKMSADVRNPAEVAGEEYASSLADLTVNSKPLINMLTMLAEENVDHADTIVKVIEKHLSQVSTVSFARLIFLL